MSIRPEYIVVNNMNEQLRNASFNHMQDAFEAAHAAANRINAVVHVLAVNNDKSKRIATIRPGN